MTIPPAKVSSGVEHAGEAVEGVRGATQRALTPPPLPQSHPAPEDAAALPASSAQVSPEPLADLSSAPTIRPPPGPATSSSLAVSALGADRRGTGFTSVIRHLSLRGWLRWIHSNQCDATLRVRARDGGNGIIWCSAGTIVDAEWSASSSVSPSAGMPDPAARAVSSPAGASSAVSSSAVSSSDAPAPSAAALDAAARDVMSRSGVSSVVAEGAVQQMLRLGSGSVSIDFDPVDRAPRVSRPTHELLHPLQTGAVLGESRRATERHWSPGSMQEPVFRPALTAPADHEAEGPAERQRSRWQPRLRWRHLSRGSYLLGGISFSALMLLAFIFGRSRGAHESELVMVSPPEMERAQQTRSGLRPPPAAAAPPLAPQVAPSPPPRPRELPVIPFAEIEVEPPQAEIWLDQSLVGVGRIELAAMSDGALHELRFVAPGHVPRSLYFLEQPPAGRILLERAGQAAAARESASEPAAGGFSLSAPARAEPLSAAAARPAPPEPPREREVVRSAPRRRAPPPRPAAEPAAAAAKATPVKKSPQIQLIDARVPRVQVLE